MPAAAQASNETITLRLPSGEEVDAIVPSGMDDKQVQALMRQKHPEYFRAPDKTPKPPSTYERLTSSVDPGALAFDEKHPLIGKGVRALSAIGGSVLGLPGAIYHAAADPETEEEKQRSGEGFEKKIGPTGRVIDRLGVQPILNAASDYAHGRVTLEGAKSVMPEALGPASLAAVPDLTEASVRPISRISNAGREFARGFKRGVTPVDTGATGAISSPVRTLPGQIGRERVYGPFRAGEGTPINEAAPIPPRSGLLLKGEVEPKPIYPGAPLPDTPPAEVLQARGIGEGAKPAPEPSKGLGRIPVRAPKEITAEPLPSESPSAPITPKHVESVLNESLGGKPLEPNVPLRKQIAKPIPVSQAKAESSVIGSHSYDPQANELHVTTKSNPNTTYVYGDVSPDQAEAFESGPSKGKAWAQFKKGSSPLVAKIVNGERVPVRPIIAPEDLNPEGSTAPQTRILSPSETAKSARAFRTRSIGEEGIPSNPQSHAQATMSQSEAESYKPHREELLGQPQETVGVDLEKTPGFSLKRGPRGNDWVKFHSNVPESAIVPLDQDDLTGILKESLRQVKAKKAGGEP